MRLSWGRHFEPLASAESKPPQDLDLSEIGALEASFLLEQESFISPREPRVHLKFPPRLNPPTALSSCLPSPTSSCLQGSRLRLEGNSEHTV